MAKVKLELESNYNEVITAFSGIGNSMSELNNEVKDFNQTSKKAFSETTREAKEFSNQVDVGAKEVNDLDNSLKNVNKTGNRIKEIKKEIKDLTSEAIRAGEGSEVFANNLRRVGELKDELNDIQAVIKGVSGSVGENLAGALGKTTSLGIKGFEGITAASSLFGAKVDDVEKQILKLQALSSLSDIAQEFAGIGDTLTQLKVAVSPITDFYTNTNAKILDFTKNAKFSFKGLATGALDLGKSLVSGIGGFIKSAISGIKSLGAVIAANPFGIILISITAIIGLLIAFKDKIKPVAEFFDFLGGILGKISDFIEDIGQALGLVASDAEKASQNIVDGINEQLDAIEKRYNREIKLAQAAGKETEEIEKKKLKSQADAIIQAIANLEFLRRVQGELNDEQLKKQKELNEKLIDIQTDLAATTIKQQVDINKKEEENRKKRLDAARKAAEERKKLEQDLQNSLNDLAKRAEQAQLQGLVGEERIKRQQELNLRELDNFKDLIIKKGQLLDKNFKLSAEQEEQFAILQRQINNQAADEIIKIQTNRANKIAEANKRQADSELELFDLQQKLAIEQVNLLDKPKGVSDEDFEIIKQKRILEIQREGIENQLKLRRKQLAKEKDLQIQSLEGELEILGQRTDAESQLRKDQIEQSLINIREKFTAEDNLILAETESSINELDAKIKEATKKLESGNKFSLAKLLGLTDEQLNNLEGAFGQFTDKFKEFTDQLISIQQQNLDFEKKQSDERLQLLDDRIGYLENELAQEKDLAKQGLSNNVDRLTQEIEAAKNARQQELQEQKRIQEERKKLAKAQLAIDTATQASQLITASSQIFNSFAALPFGIGIPLAIATIALMIGSFVTAKLKAFQAINQGAGFKKGGYTGDSPIDKEVGVVHGQEFVHTAEKTRKYYDLFEGIHTGDKKLIELGLVDLLKDTGVKLPDDIPQNIKSKKDAIKLAELKYVALVDNSGIERRIDELNKKLDKIISQNDEELIVHGDKLIQRKGSYTKIVRKKDA